MTSSHSKKLEVLTLLLCRQLNSATNPCCVPVPHHAAVLPRYAAVLLLPDAVATTACMLARLVAPPYSKSPLANMQKVKWTKEVDWRTRDMDDWYRKRSKYHFGPDAIVSCSELIVAYLVVAMKLLYGLNGGGKKSCAENQSRKKSTKSLKPVASALKKAERAAGGVLKPRGPNLKVRTVVLRSAAGGADALDEHVPFHGEEKTFDSMLAAMAFLGVGKTKYYECAKRGLPCNNWYAKMRARAHTDPHVCACMYTFRHCGTIPGPRTCMLRNML